MRPVALTASLLFLLTPLAASAFPFGGQAGMVIPCYNQAIYASLGPPRGGPYVWTPSTKTYQFGAPTHAGQWLLGLAGAPYYCIVSVQPVIVWPGTYITMMGSSGPSAPAAPQQTPSQPSQPEYINRDDYCRNRNTPSFSGANDPCDVPSMSCDQINQRGYKLVERCM